jgi:hypothetical protein
MKTCPTCHRTVPDNVAVCPHADCGKPLPSAHGASKRPPPPGPVRLNPGSAPHGRPATVDSAPASTMGRSRRGPIATVALLILLLALGGGIYYAAAVLKYARVEPGLRLVRNPSDAKKVVLRYHPLSEGQLVVRRSVAAGEATVIHKTGAGDEEQFELPFDDISAGEELTATFRDGWWTHHEVITVGVEPTVVRPDKKPTLADNRTVPAPKLEPEEFAAKETESGPTPMIKDKKPAAEVAAIAPPSEPLGLYAERTRVDREQWISQVGGTPDSELGVAAGLEWLARHQAEDGHWGPDCLGPNGLRCEKDHPCTGPGQNFEAALTGLALLAFQAGGHYYFNDRPRSDNVRRGLDWLVAGQGPNGELVGTRNHLGHEPGAPAQYEQRYMYEHAIGTFALAEACALALAVQRHPDEKYVAAAIKAVQFVESQQHNDGGWRYNPDKASASDTSVSGWSMLALKTAKEADLSIEPATISRMTAFFKRSAEPLTGRTHYQGLRFETDATTGVGMMVDEFVTHQSDSDLIHLGSTYLAGEAEARWGAGGRNDQSDYYLWYNCTLAMFMAGGEPWKRWNDVVRDHILSLQVRGTDCARGSWEPNDRWSSEGGRVYSTALAVLSLEVYYRFAREPTDKAEDSRK